MKNSTANKTHHQVHTHPIPKVIKTKSKKKSIFHHQPIQLFPSLLHKSNIDSPFHIFISFHYFFSYATEKKDYTNIKKVIENAVHKKKILMFNLFTSAYW
jgi:hypothetical protein